MSEDSNNRTPSSDNEARGPLHKVRASGERTQSRKRKAGAQGNPLKTDAAMRLEQLNRAVLIGTFTTVAALIFGIASIVSSQMTVSTVTSNMTDIVIASREIPMGTTITKDMVEMKSVPESYVASASLGSTAEVIGKTANFAITQNSQVTSGMLADANNATTLSAKISEGSKAITLNVASNTGLYNLLRCGDRVDVYVTNSETYETEVIASKVCVLALDSSLSGPDSSTKYSTATLQVTESQAAAILTGEQQGVISLALNPLSEQGGA